MKLIDTHSHINFVNFKDDGDEVIKRSLSNNTELIIVGAEFKTSKRAINYANKYTNGVYAAVGLHPIHLEEIVADEGIDGTYNTRAEVFNRDQYEKIIHTEKVVAIGEIGLDYYHLKLTSDINKIKEKQKKVFLEQLLMARMADLPVIIHCRSAHLDMLKILKDFKDEHKSLIKNDEPWGVVHCFSGDENLAWEYFNLGLMISFTGIITFSKQYDDLIRKMPSDKFMIETDCPFLTPEPYRGKRNEPVLVWYVANRIAEIRNTKIEKIADISTKNAKFFFDI